MTKLLTSLALAAAFGFAGLAMDPPKTDPPNGGGPSGEVLDFAGDPPKTDPPNGGGPSGEVLDFV